MGVVPLTGSLTWLYDRNVPKSLRAFAGLSGHGRFTLSTHRGRSFSQAGHLGIMLLCKEKYSGVLMKLKNWALIAEVGSALAVVVTLAILVVGVRDNTRSTQAATYQALMTDINRADFALLEDPSLFANLFAVDALTFDAEQAQVALMTRILSRSMEAAYFSHRNGSLDDSQWERFHRNICGIRALQGPEVWETIEGILTEEFASHLDENCPASSTN